MVAEEEALGDLASDRYVEVSQPVVPVPVAKCPARTVRVAREAQGPSAVEEVPANEEPVEEMTA